MAAAVAAARPELAPLLHQEPSVSGTSPHGSRLGGNTPGGAISHGTRLVVIGALACCGAVVAAVASSSSAGVVSTHVVALGSAGKHHGGARVKVNSPHAARRAAALGRENNRVLMSPAFHLAYCNVPKAASSTVTTYMTGLNAGINTFKGVEEFIIANGGDSHFAMTQYSTFKDAEMAEAMSDDGASFKVFTVVRHPGTRLYSTWFDKIHSHRGSDQPDLLWYGCNNDEDCSFEQFVDGITAQINDPEAKLAINEHVEPQADMCNPHQRDFDGVFKLEDGFANIEQTLKKWTGADFDFESEDGETGYSHHNAVSREVYSEFPVSDAAGYESLMPFAIQKKIYDAYKTDFDLFHYPPPVKKNSQLETCPTIKWTNKLLQSEWGGEDAKHLVELEQEGVLNPNLAVAGGAGAGPSREELAKPRAIEKAREGEKETGTSTGGQSAGSGNDQQETQAETQPQNVPTAFGGNELLVGEDYDGTVASSSSNGNTASTATQSPNTVTATSIDPSLTDAASEVAAKKQIALESVMQRTTDEQKEWEAEVEEARRLHDDTGLSASDAIAKAHSEAVWLKAQKRKLEHASKMLELDQKYLNAKRAETKRLVEVESFDWPSADAKADGEAKWLRQREEEKIGLTEQMRAAESQKRHELAIQASEAEGLTLRTDADATRGSAVPVELQNAVGMNFVDPLAGDYAEIDAGIPGLNPVVVVCGKHDTDKQSLESEKASVEAQWLAPDADVKDIQAEYSRWMKRHGKKTVPASGDVAKVSKVTKKDSRLAKREKPEPSASAAVDDVVKAPSQKAVQLEKKKAQAEFARWKSANNVESDGEFVVGGDSGDGHSETNEDDGGSEEISGTRDYEPSLPVDPARNAVITFGDGVVGTSTDFVNPGTGLVDPEEVAEHEERAQAQQDLLLSSAEDADKLARFEAWKKENQNLDYDEDVVKPVPISTDGRVMTHEQARQEAEQALVEEAESEEYTAWAAAQWGHQNGQGAKPGLGDAESKRAKSSKDSKDSSSVSSLGHDETFNIFDAPAGHRLDFMMEIEPFLEMRSRVQADHDLLASELDAIRVATPDVFKLIQENMNEFKRFMMDGVSDAFVKADAQKPLPSADEVFGYLGRKER